MENTDIFPELKSDRLAALRRSKELTKEAIDAGNGVTYNYYWRLATGRRSRAKASNLGYLATLLNTTTDYLLGLTDAPERHYIPTGSTPEIDKDRIAKLRHDLGIPKDVLAQRMGYTVRTVERIEDGSRKHVSCNTVARFALALHTTMDYLLGLTDEPGVPGIPFHEQTHEQIVDILWQNPGLEPPDVIREVPPLDTDPDWVNESLIASLIEDHTLEHGPHGGVYLSEARALRRTWKEEDREAALSSYQERARHAQELAQHRAEERAQEIAGRVYRGEIDEDGHAFVTVDDEPLALRLDLANHSPTGFAWGYEGSGAAQLALAILADALDSEDHAKSLYHEYKHQEVANWPWRDEEVGNDGSWQVTGRQVREWAVPFVPAWYELIVHGDDQEEEVNE